MAAGCCLCGSVQYSVTGPLRDVINCHCWRCRRHTGHVLAATQCLRDDLHVDSTEGLRWYSPDGEVEYGFCEECGSTLFWRCGARADEIAIAAGTIDTPTGLTTQASIWTLDASDYYTIDGSIPSHPFGTDGNMDSL